MCTLRVLPFFASMPELQPPFHQGRGRPLLAASGPPVDRECTGSLLWGLYRNLASCRPGGQGWIAVFYLAGRCGCFARSPCKKYSRSSIAYSRASRHRSISPKRSLGPPDRYGDKRINGIRSRAHLKLVVHVAEGYSMNHIPLQ